MLLRWHDRGAHQRPHADLRTARGRANVGLSVQGAGSRCPPDRRRTQRRDGPGRERAKGRRPAADHGRARSARRTAIISGPSASIAVWSTSSPCRTRSPRSVVSTLKGRLAADKSAAVVAPRSRDLEAYGFYLEGRYHWNKRTEDELKKSVGVLRAGDRSRPGLRARPMPAWRTPTSRSARTAPCRPRT